MIRAAHTLYRVVLSLLPDEWSVRPPLVWHWDNESLLRVAKIDPVEREREQGYAIAELWALWDHEYETINVTMELADKAIAKIVLTYLHELAHANGIDDEKAADAAALDMYRRIARRAAWKQMGIKLMVRRGDKYAVVDDKVYSLPSRLPEYEPPWNVD